MVNIYAQHKYQSLNPGVFNWIKVKPVDIYASIKAITKKTRKLLTFKYYFLFQEMQILHH